MQVISTKKFQSRSFIYDELILSPIMEIRHEQMLSISARYNLHPLTIKDCVQINKCAKINFFNEYKFIVWYYFHPSLEKPIEINIIIGENYLLMVANTVPTHIAETWKMICFPEGQNVVLNDSLYQMFDIFIKHIERYIDALDYERSLLEARTTHSYALKKILQIKRLVYELNQTIFISGKIFSEFFSKTIATDEQKIYLQNINERFKQIKTTIDFLQEKTMLIYDVCSSTKPSYPKKATDRLRFFLLYFLFISCLSSFFSMRLAFIPYKELWFHIFAACLFIGIPISIYVFFHLRKSNKLKKHKKFMDQEKKRQGIHPFMKRKFNEWNNVNIHPNQK